MGIHPHNSGKKWLVQLKDHHYYERNREDLASGEDRRTLNPNYASVTFWDAQPGLLTSSDGQTTILYDNNGITVKTIMGDNYQDISSKVCKDGEMLVPKNTYLGDSRQMLESLGFIVNEISNDIKVRLKASDIENLASTMFYRCTVPDDYEIYTNSIGATLEKSVESRESDWKTTGLATLDKTILTIIFRPEWYFNGQRISANMSVTKKKEQEQIKAKVKISWSDLIETLELKENEYVIPNINYFAKNVSNKSGC